MIKNINLNKIFITVLLYLVSHNATSNIDYHRAMIAEASRSYGLHPSILTSIVIIESTGNPWTFNIDGEGMQFSSKNEAIKKFNEIAKNRWLVKYKNHKKEMSRLFFPSKEDALFWITSFRKNSNNEYSLNEQKLINIENDQIVLRELNLLNTDIGLSQINYRWHGKRYKKRFNFYQWLNPDLNLYYAAKHIKELYIKHGSMRKAVAYYHSSTKKYQEIYLKKFLQVYKKEVEKNRL